MSESIQFYGSLASITGLLISLVGFFLTIRNVLKSKNTVLQVKDAVGKVREDMRKIDIVNELSLAITAMQEIIRLHKDKNWAGLTDRYIALNNLLYSIRQANPQLSDRYKKDML